MLFYDRDIKSFRIVAEEDRNQAKLWCDSIITLQSRVRMVPFLTTLT